VQPVRPRTGGLAYSSRLLEIQLYLQWRGCACIIVVNRQKLFWVLGRCWRRAAVRFAATWMAASIASSWISRKQAGQDSGSPEPNLVV